MTKKILLVEDDENDVYLIKEAIEKLEIDVELEVCSDGREFSKRIEGVDDIPHLILLDLNLPFIPGQELLERLQEDPIWRKVPVCILSSSKAHQDVILTYSRCANCYIAKPIDFNRFVAVVGSTIQFWFETAELPQDESHT